MISNQFGFVWFVFSLSKDSSDIPGTEDNLIIWKSCQPGINFQLAKLKYMDWNSLNFTIPLLLEVDQKKCVLPKMCLNFIF